MPPLSLPVPTVTNVPGRKWCPNVSENTNRAPDERPGPGVARRHDSGGAEHGLDLELDGDLVADDDAAAVHRHVDVDPVGLAGDLGLGGEGGARAAVGVRAEAVELQLEGDGLGDALDGEVALDGPVGAVSADAGGAEGHLGVVAHVEEVG